MAEGRWAEGGVMATTIQDLVAVEYQLKSEFGTDVPRHVITFTRMRSPFYHGDRWAVRFSGRVLNTSGEWEWEPQPSSRDDEFYARCRFGSLEAALQAYDRAERP